MPETVINMVAFDIPYPANYGGSIDIFYKLKTLKEKGIAVILHCFEYNKSEQPELENYCKSVVYYPRNKGLKFLFSPLPYIVVTRKHQQLLKNLKANDFPILFEGLHSCAFLDAPELKNRKKIVRTHNIEHDYYSGLQKASKNLFTKTYYAFESRKLKRYEPVLQHANAILSISPNDFKYFSKQYENVGYIPAFHPFYELKSKPGEGTYFLYHGNLSVEENEMAVHFLIDQVFNRLEAQLIVAGKTPGKKLPEKISKLPNVTLQSNPSEEEMNNLMQNAQACVLPTFQGTGLKLKLLTSLFSSRYVIANPTMVNNTGLEDLCELADSAEEFIAAINKISTDEFTTEQISERKQKLVEFTNDFNGDKLLKIIEEL
ncbi:glycosyltransferase family 4 protein [Maribellus sediminis]|uniref:glycosyltransferase family 4 protein n=1 Tax=Maribellus sediminis TaxID=2696285 RepID=UPI001431CCEC|nr:glycosyltransferase family 4 protein [Maribellus sediminis]